MHARIGMVAAAALLGTAGFAAARPATDRAAGHQTPRLAGVRVVAGGRDCAGSDCLEITDVRHGTRCGQSTSVEADYRNASDTQYLRGYIVFDTPGGPRYEPTGLMSPGSHKKGWSAAFVCDGSGTPDVLANTHSNSALVSYPKKPRER